MGNLAKALVCLLIFSFTSIATSLESKQEQRAAMEAILLELNVHYGMAEFKKEQFGVTIEKLRSKYGSLIDKAMTLEELNGLEAGPNPKRAILSQLEFQQIMIGLIAELRDGHVNTLRQTRNAATLGIQTVAIDGRLYVAGFYDAFFLPNQFTQKVEIGDEILEVNGESVQSIARKRLLYTFGGTFESRWDRALRNVIEVPYALYMPMPEGQSVDLKLKKGEKTYVGRVPWVERRDYDFVRSLFMRDEDHSMRAMMEDAPIAYGGSGFVRSYFRQGLLNMRMAEGTIMDVGSLLNQELINAKMQRMMSRTPLSMEEQMQEVAPVTRLLAHIVRYKGKNIGVLRIPSYSPGSFMDLRNELLWLQKMMSRLEASTDMLVLDVLSNSGGSVFQASRITSYFAKDEPLPSIKMNLRLNETLIESLRPSGNEPHIEELRPKKFVEWHLDKKFFATLEEKFKKGEKWSGFHPAFSLGIEGHGDDFGRLFAPLSVSYKKPLLILNDRFSGSGGDFVPAILQAAGRAYVMGEISAGLGGPVYRNISSMPGSELSMRCTMGMCLRSDDLPIENLGVVDDVPRYIRQGDMKDGFRSYAQDVLEVALGVIEGKDRKKLQDVVNARAQGQELSGVSLKAQKLAEEYSQSFSLVQTPEDWMVLLSEYWPKVAKMKEVTSDQWRNIVLPLPTPLVESDLILSALWRRDEVLSRLQEMRGLKNIQDRADLSAMIDFILDWSKKFDGEIRFGAPCELQLLKRYKRN